MDRVRIKICGLMRPEDIETVNEVCPDYAGFILAQGRRRTVSPTRMRELTMRLRPEVQRTAVFLDQDPKWIAVLAREDLMDVIQLHGRESDEQIRFLQRQTGRKIIKAYRIETAADIRTAQKSAADLVLLDNGDGGTGKSFDWSLLLEMKRPYILAGGLSPDNVRDAILRTRPYGVDVSSGVESFGYKDARKIRQFTEAVRCSAPQADA